MKILLDENTPGRFKSTFPADHEIFTAREMGWNGKRNGELLALAVSSGFELFITLDKNLRYQQKLNKFEITIFLLSAPDNERKTFEKLFVKANMLLASGAIEKFHVIEV